MVLPPWPSRRWKTSFTRALQDAPGRDAVVLVEAGVLHGHQGAEEVRGDVPVVHQDALLGAVFLEDLAVLAEDAAGEEGLGELEAVHLGDAAGEVEAQGDPRRRSHQQEKQDPFDEGPEPAGERGPPGELGGHQTPKCL